MKGVKGIRSYSNTTTGMHNIYSMLLDHIPNTKNCNVCNRLVYFVDSDKKLARAIKNNQCVAIKRSSNGMRKKRSSITVGVINPINFDEPTYLRKTK
jgi:hypothetical protein